MQVLQETSALEKASMHLKKRTRDQAYGPEEPDPLQDIGCHKRALRAAPFCGSPEIIEDWGQRVFDQYLRQDGT